MGCLSSSGIRCYEVGQRMEKGTPWWLLWSEKCLTINEHRQGFKRRFLAFRKKRRKPRKMPLQLVDSWRVQTRRQSLVAPPDKLLRISSQARSQELKVIKRRRRTVCRLQVLRSRAAALLEQRQVGDAKATIEMPGQTA